MGKSSTGKRERREAKRRGLRQFSVEELEQFEARCREKLSEDDAEILSWMVFTLISLFSLLSKSRMSIRRLRAMVFGSRSEKTSEVLKPTDSKEQDPPQNQEDPDDDQPPQPPSTSGNKPKPKGHGRNGADKQTGATEVFVPCSTVAAHQRCPSCLKGKIYLFEPAGTEVRFCGVSPVQATVYRLEKLRCELCGELYTAELPAEAGTRRYDESVASTIAVLKYDASMPLFRLEGFLESFGIRLSDATMWQILSSADGDLRPILDELYRQAARAHLVYIDDTGNRIVQAPREGTPGRKGIFTTGLIADTEERQIALFFTGRKHAGENLTDLLSKRPADLPPVQRMADGLSRNNPKGFKAILLKCLTHGRRGFAEVAHLFPEACRYVLETIRDVYRVDAFAKKKNLSPQQRLRLHQRYSGPRMGRLKRWLRRQTVDHLVEPNSSLGKAIRYMLKHWRELIAFLKYPGAPLDTNIVERALRRVVLLRKNALFFRTPNGAKVADLFMSLIATCRLGGVDPFRYLTTAQKNRDRVRDDPAAWLPWNYEAALA